MAQVSNIDSDFSGGAEDPRLVSAGDHTDESKSKSLLNKVKDKAKGTVRKIKSKVKKGSSDSEDRPLSGEGQSTDEDLDESSIERQSELKAGTQSPNEVTGRHNGSTPREAFGGKSEDDILSSFARSGTSQNSPLVAVPTSYSEPNSTVDAVMPPSVIKPTSVSDLGEESSSNLGHIPEAKDAEKAAVKEVQQDGPDSDNGGFKDTFKQKDLQAIDGLPKPRGFDMYNQSSVKSNLSNLSSGSGFLGSQDLADQAPLQDIEPTAYKGGMREFPSDGTKGTCGLEQDNQKLHPVGTTAEFHDSMFSSHAVHDLKPNEPNAAEALDGGSTETLSRGFDPETNQSSGTEGGLQHPPASHSELHENMFSSALANDLKPSQTDEPSPTLLNSGGDVPTGDLSREGDSDENTTFHEAPKELPPPTKASGPPEESRKLYAAAGSSAALDEMPVAGEQEAENYFDAVPVEEETASERSLESDEDKDFNPDATAEYAKQEKALSESADSRIDAASKDKDSKIEAQESPSTIASAFKSVLSSVGYGSPSSQSASDSHAPAQDISSGTASNTGDSVSSTPPQASSLFSKAMGAFTGTPKSEQPATDQDKGALPAQ